MNIVSICLLILITAAVGFGIYRMIKRKGKCNGCSGNCDECGKHT